MTDRVDAALGVDRSEFSWKDLAACRNMNPTSPEDDWFFDVYETNKDAARAVDQICMSCPVQKICAAHGRDNRLEGVWGGVYWTPGGKPDAARNNHKTQDDWKELEEALDMKLTRRGGSNG